jgi:hypothetical protein
VPIGISALLQGEVIFLAILLLLGGAFSRFGRGKREESRPLS